MLHCEAVGYGGGVNVLYGGKVTHNLFNGNPDGDYYDHDTARSLIGAASINGLPEASDNVDRPPSFETAEDASQFLIRERSICTVPWDDAGAYLRFSVTYQAPAEADEDALMAELERRLARDRFVW